MIGLAATVITITTGHSPFTPSDPTPTLKGSGDNSGWAGHLPDPCVGVPDDAIRAAGLDPTTRNRGWRDLKGENEVIISCYYSSPQPVGIEYNATYTWSLSIDFLIDTYQEYFQNSSRVDQRRTKINGQPATFFRVENWGASRGLHECMVAIGTVFGIAIYTINDDTNAKMTQQQTCDKTVLAATHFQPYISTAPLQK
ncbi:DUF3558 family protein [Gordonia sp. X0973]|uniref:DUF3558 family protein n=1 Tax=Gordonia sp. X0973 TaxID=2742602 RepID=UPI0013ED4277|nr:DUF3558 family protein [Gordonia sp. X0973]QKT06973.1 DUF3558 family protein [Gordonia sp. X0973]